MACTKARLRKPVAHRTCTDLQAALWVGEGFLAAMDKLRELQPKLVGPKSTADLHDRPGASSGDGQTTVTIDHLANADMTIAVAVKVCGATHRLALQVISCLHAFHLACAIASSTKGE